MGMGGVWEWQRGRGVNGNGVWRRQAASALPQGGFSAKGRERPNSHPFLNKNQMYGALILAFET